MEVVWQRDDRIFVRTDVDGEAFARIVTVLERRRGHLIKVLWQDGLGSRSTPNDGPHHAEACQDAVLSAPIAAMTEINLAKRSLSYHKDDTEAVLSHCNQGYLS